MYHYTSLCELAKMLKYECPKPLLDSYNLSQRNNRNLIILPSHKNYQFNYKSSALWNQLLKALKIPSVYEMDINVFKFTLKKYQLNQQQLGDELNWTDANNNLL